MISFPPPGSNPYDTSNSVSLRYSEKQQAQAEVQVKTDEGAQVKVSASYSSETTVTLSGGTPSNTSGTPVKGVDQYAAISGDPAPERTQAASNILSFIGLRLEQDLADGATPEELASRLQAGYEGFVQGYQEAYEQLSASGLLTPEVEDAISQTYEQVLAGIDALAEELGVESPVKESPVKEGPVSEPVEEVAEAPAETGNLASQSGLQSPQDLFASLTEELANPAEDLVKMMDASLLDYSKLDYQTNAERDFSFKLRTQDGDFVKITAGASISESGSYRDGSSVSGSYAESSRFSLSVEGQLDEGELAAINDLLSQVGDLSEAFFAGDIEQAFNMALEIGFDENEIAQFSLSLNQSVETKVQAVYQNVESPDVALNNDQDYAKSALEDAKNNEIRLLSSFIDMLQDVAEKAEALGFERSDISRFAAFVAEGREGSEGEGKRVEKFMDRMLESMPERAVPPAQAQAKRATDL